jgi:DNA repair protein RecO (recombination protein O)
MERFTEHAVVLSTVDYGEADRMVTLFTRERGKLTAFAAGARKSKRRFAGALEPFTSLKVSLCERHSDTFRLDGADIQASYPRVREDLARIARALYCVELCRELVRDREPHTQLYELLVDYLAQLDRQEAGPTSLIAFELDALAQAGLMPRFDACSLCSGEYGPRPRFDPSHGGVVCELCASGFPVSRELMHGLRDLQAGARTPLSAEQRRQARELLNLFIVHHLGRKLNSVDFMAQVGLD